MTYTIPILKQAQYHHLNYLEEERLISLPQPQPLFRPAQLCNVIAITQKANIPLKILFFIYQK